VNKLHRTLILLFIVFVITNAYPQENEIDQENWFQRHFEQRLYLGFYDSFGDEKSNVTQIGYDAVLKLINITPIWNLIDFNLGLNVLFIRDQINKENVDNFGHVRKTENRLIPGFEVNWGIKLYFLTIPKIKTSLYLDAAPITLVLYTQSYPELGTHFNVGTHVGFGIKSKINDVLKGYATLRIFSHISNGKPEEINPALDMVGLIVGLQF